MTRLEYLAAIQNSCKCNTKTNLEEYHQQDCPFRIITEQYKQSCKDRTDQLLQDNIELLERLSNK